jgi:guanylate kinase
LSEYGPGHLLVISAPSGGGKTSLVRALLQATRDLCVSVSHTTRTQRAGETDGADYYFINHSRFEQMVNDDDFLEHAKVFDHRYGTARSAITAHLSAGTDVILEIDWQGARSIRGAVRDTISIFILPPSVAELERRLRGRGDSAANVQRRMRDAVSEMSHYHEYDYLVINDDFDNALTALSAIITAARHRRPVQQARNTALLSELVQS